MLPKTGCKGRADLQVLPHGREMWLRRRGLQFSRGSPRKDKFSEFCLLSSLPLITDSNCCLKDGMTQERHVWFCTRLGIERVVLQAKRQNGLIWADGGHSLSLLPKKRLN